MRNSKRSFVIFSNNPGQPDRELCLVCHLHSREPNRHAPFSTGLQAVRSMSPDESIVRRISRFAVEKNRLARPGAMDITS
jgi:mRNA-degrading endonuclease toxin of MazEF toxin-antitoxin module